MNGRIELALQDVMPQLVIACYGMNDGIYKPLDPGRTKAFQDGMTAFVGSCRKFGAQVVLITPPAFETEDTSSTDDNPPPNGPWIIGYSIQSFRVIAVLVHISRSSSNIFQRSLLIAD